MNEMIRNFSAPSSAYRPAPLWVWNDEMTEEQIDFQLEELHAHGFGGAFVHPRPGLVTEYLSDRWFAMWGHALEKSKALGMKLYIYDENSYPSGFAGGHVSGICPEAISVIMRYRVVDKPEHAWGARVAVFAAEEQDGRLVNAKNLAGIPESEWPKYGSRYLVVTQEQTGPSGWMAGFAYVDLLRPQVTKAFLETTHEQYFKHFGADFGTNVPALFTDEPSLSQCGGGALPFSYWLAHEFKKRCGYDLLKNLPCVYENIEGDCFDYPPEKVRFDYFDTLHELWTRNALEVTGKWCEEHNINWTGHYLEHQWPFVNGNVSPAMQSNYEYHQWPAIDMLLSTYLRDRPTHSLTHTIRELKSASNQFGKERTLCELYGAGGWDSTFEDYKRMADWVLVNGVNFINQHLTYSTIMGARKHDHPQSFDWRESWWNEYTGMNDYIGRVSYMLTRGKMEQRILVLNPALTGYTVEQTKASGDMFGNGNLNCISNPDMTGFLTLTQTLTDLQWDYDLGDEYTLARHACVKDGALEVVRQRYRCVIVSGDMQNMLSSTAELLKACEQAGVKVIALGTPGPLVDGLAAPETYAALASGWTQTDLAQLDTLLGEWLPRRISASVPFPAGFDHMRRKLEDGSEVWFFVNHAMEPYSAELRLHGRSARVMNLFTGEVSPAVFTERDGALIVPVELARNQSLMLLVSDEAGESTQPVQKIAGQALALHLRDIVQESENCFPISYADYAEEKGAYVKTLCDRIFRERGFDGNPWDNKVQFRRNIMDRDGDYDERSGFTAAYHFQVAEGFVPARMEAVAEHPEYCRLRVNGTDVAWKEGEWWLDHHFGVADIARYVRSGENTVEVVVDVFHVLMELETIYIKGDFSLEAQGDRWVVTPAHALTLGSWREQGLPFYPWAVRYVYSVTLDDAPQQALFAPEVSGQAFSLTVNGQDAGLLYADGRRPADLAPWLHAGENTVELRVCGSQKNLLGPHFTRARGTAWPGMWRAYPAHTPAPEQFDLLDFGLHTQPVLTVG